MAGNIKDKTLKQKVAFPSINVTFASFMYHLMPISNLGWDSLSSRIS
jgi:hypothetical protein